MIPTYQRGETVAVPLRVDDFVDLDEQGAEVYACAFVIAGADPIEVQVPLSALAVERRTPADGPPAPGEVWADRYRNEWHASGRDADALTMTDAEGCRVPWQTLHAEAGPITRVRATRPAAEPVECLPCGAIHPAGTDPHQEQ